MTDSITKFLNSKLKKPFKNENFPLWHGIKLENAVTVLKQDFMEPRTTQRYWEDGKSRKDKDPDYESSKWMKGWSMSREFDYAFLWAGLVFEFDRNEIQNNFEIIPINWGNTISNLKYQNYKREREEFVVSLRTGKSISDYEAAFESYYDSLEEEYQKNKDPSVFRNLKYDSFIDIFKEPEGRVLDNLKIKIKGIYISDYLINIYGEKNENIQFILQQPNFKGVIPEYFIKQRQENYSNLQKSLEQNIKKNKI